MYQATFLLFFNEFRGIFFYFIKKWTKKETKLKHINKHTPNLTFRNHVKLMLNKVSAHKMV